MKENKGDHGGNIWEFARKVNCSPREILDFSSNLNAISPIEPRKIVLNKWNFKFYPDTDTRIYLDALEEYAGVKKENILLGPGLTYLIYRVNQLFSQKRIAIISPSFSEYYKSAISSKSSINTIAWTSEEDVNKLVLRLDNMDYDLMFIARPANPLGDYISDEDLEILISQNERRGSFTFVDEAFIDFVARSNTNFQERTLKNYENVIFGRSLTKLFGLASLRLGYIISSKTVIAQIEHLMEPWVLGQYVLDFLSHVDFSGFNDLPEKTRIEREFLISELQQIGFTTISTPSANFLTASPPPGLSASFILDELSSARIMAKEIRGIPGHPQAIRFAVKNRKSNAYLIKSLKEITCSSRLLSRNVKRVRN